MSALGHEIGVAIKDAVVQAPDFLASTLASMTWGEWIGLFVYLLGMRAFAELMLEHRAQAERLPRYMFRLTSDDWPSLVFWPFIVAAMVALFYAERKENAQNAKGFTEAQMRLERKDRHPHFR